MNDLVKLNGNKNAVTRTALLTEFWVNLTYYSSFRGSSATTAENVLELYGDALKSAPML